MTLSTYVCQERGLSLYDDQQLKNDEDFDSGSGSLRDALLLAVPDETASGETLCKLSSIS